MDGSVNVTVPAESPVKLTVRTVLELITSLFTVPADGIRLAMPLAQSVPVPVKVRVEDLPTIGEPVTLSVGAVPWSEGVPPTVTAFPITSNVLA